MNKKQTGAGAEKVTKLTGEGIEKNSLAYRQKILHPGATASAPSDFLVPSSSALYCGLRDAPRQLRHLIQSGPDEDLITSKMLAAVQLRIQNAQPEDAPRLAFCDLWAEGKKKVNETRSGADFLLLIEGLTPQGGFRAFWIQAKKELHNDPYKINCFRPVNSEGYQLDTLRKMHDPVSGSFAMYLAYSKIQAAMPTLLVSDITKAAPTKESEGEIELDPKGAWAPENVIYFATRPTTAGSIGVFATPQDFIFWLSERVGDFPMFLAVYSTVEAPAVLLEAVRDYYFQKMNINQPSSPGSESQINEPGENRNTPRF